jgi:TonB family protein
LSPLVGRASLKQRWERVTARLAPFLFAIAVMAASGSDHPVFAAAASTQFNIPRQSLVTAIEAFGNATHTQIIYDSHIAVGRQSPGVHGSYGPSEALSVLLTGTGLVGGYQGPNSLVLVARPSELPSGAPAAYMPEEHQSLALDTLRVEAGPIPDFYFRSYALLIQSEVQRALQKEDEAGAHPLRIKIWVDGGGTIRQSALFVSSGNQQADEQILRRLQGLALQSPPPAGFPQPIHIRIRD